MIDNNLEHLVSEYARANLSPTELERGAITSRYEQLRKFLAGRTFQTGSYARFTSTTPVNDLDVIYVLPEEILEQVRTVKQAVDPARLDIRSIVDSLADQLRRLYGATASVQTQPHSVGVFFGKKHDFSIDVVPAAPAEGGMYWIPEIARRSIAVRREQYRFWQAQARLKLPPGPNWVKSHPKGYIEQASRLNVSTEGKFRKAVKVLKKWRWSLKRANDTFRLKSFHLELAVTGYFLRNPNARCVEAIGGVVGELDRLIEAPQFPDLANHAQFVDQYVATLTDSDRKLLQREFSRAQFLWAEVERAETAPKVRQALEAFVEVTDSPMPTRGVSTTDGLVAVILEGDREGPEEFLGDYGIPYRPRYRVKVDATVTRDGFRPFKLLTRALPLLGKLRGLEFFISSCDVPEPYEVRWKVKNTGAEARRKNAFRGQIHPDRGDRRKRESTLYWGNHYVECYVVKDGVCVAADHIDVPIGPRE